jgi:hypothetical protein
LEAGTIGQLQPQYKGAHSHSTLVGDYMQKHAHVNGLSIRCHFIRF